MLSIIVVALLIRISFSCQLSNAGVPTGGFSMRSISKRELHSRMAFLNFSIFFNMYMYIEQ